MGIAVVGGMLSSTVLTLLVIPVVYTLFADLAHLLSRRGKVVPAPAERPAEMASLLD